MDPIEPGEPVESLPDTIHDAANALRSGRITSEQLTSAYLARVRALDPQLHAFMHLTDDAAMASARAADASFARGIDRGPLQGIPIGVKDLFAMQDAPTTAGSDALPAGWGRGREATVITRLRAARAVILGTLTMWELALGFPDRQKGFPIARNPWGAQHGAGGSSSGAGVAVAAGMVLGALGSDTGGSVRVPAAYNGHTGLKTTFGRVPVDGVVPLAPSLDTLGPMTRTARDAALMLRAIAGSDPRDPYSVDAPVPDYTAELSGSVRGLRIGLPTAYFFDSDLLQPETREAVLEAVRSLEAAGARVDEVAIPHCAEAREARTVITACESFAIHRAALAAQPERFGRFARQTLAKGALYSGADYVQALRVRGYFAQTVARLMSSLDVLVTPTMPGPAPTRDESGRGDLGSYVGVWNLIGVPALALPCGQSRGLPVSMQLIGKPFAEGTLLRVGEAYQRISEWHLQTPPLDGVPAAASAEIADVLAAPEAIEVAS